MGHDFEPSKEQQNRVFAIGWYSSPCRCDTESIRSCSGRVSVNPYKDTWYRNSQGNLNSRVVTPRQLVESKLAMSRYVMTKKKSDRTKWERIGRPMFVETPMWVLSTTTDVLFKVGKLKRAWLVLAK